MKLTIRKISRKEVSTKFGNKIKVGVKTDEYPNVWLGGFENSDNRAWKEGDSVEVESVKQNGEYWNFYMPKKTEQFASEIQEIKKMIKEIHDRIVVIPKPENKETDYTPDEDLPF